MTLVEKARKMRAAMETAAVSLDDATASTAPEMFPRLKRDGSLVKAGTRICWGGTLKRAAVDLWDNAENTPDAAPHAVGGRPLSGRNPRHPGGHHRRSGLRQG